MPQLNSKFVSSLHAISQLMKPFLWWLVHLLLLSSSPELVASAVAPPADRECGICLETLLTESNSTETIIPNCDHTFHSECILDWVRRAHDTCPNCRGNIGPYLETFLPPPRKQYTTMSTVPLSIVASFILFFTVLLGFQVVTNPNHAPPATTIIGLPFQAFLFSSMFTLAVWIFILFSHVRPGLYRDIDPLIELLHR